MSYLKILVRRAAGSSRPDTILPHTRHWSSLFDPFNTIEEMPLFYPDSVHSRQLSKAQPVSQGENFLPLLQKRQKIDILREKDKKSITGPILPNNQSAHGGTPEFPETTTETNVITAGAEPPYPKEKQEKAGQRTGAGDEKQHLIDVNAPIFREPDQDIAASHQNKSLMQSQKSSPLLFTKLVDKAVTIRHNQTGPPPSGPEVKETASTSKDIEAVKPAFQRIMPALAFSSIATPRQRKQKTTKKQAPPRLEIGSLKVDVVPVIENRNTGRPGHARKVRSRNMKKREINHQTSKIGFGVGQM